MLGFGMLNIHSVSSSASSLFLLWRSSAMFKRSAYSGNSVCAFVHGFEPYFYAKCVNSKHTPLPDDLPAITEALNVRSADPPVPSCAHALPESYLTQHCDSFTVHSMSLFCRFCSMSMLLLGFLVPQACTLDPPFTHDCRCKS